VYDNFMKKSLTIALAQANFTVGAIAHNAQHIIDFTKKAASQGADLVVFPEMAITGYPAEDLLFKGGFQRAAMDAVSQIATALTDCSAAALVGGFWVDAQGKRFNSAFLMDGGQVLQRCDKHWLPNYGVFDEKRLFSKGGYLQPVQWRGVSLGILICEDMWKPSAAEALAEQGAELLLVLNASPFELNKHERRLEAARTAAQSASLPLLYCNLVGGQDELVFDGGSFALHPSGEAQLQAPFFEEALLLAPLVHHDALGWRITEQDSRAAAALSSLAQMDAAMVLGLRDYVEKNGFRGVVIGISGGIDSGLTAAIAVDALGAARVHGLLMPSPYTSRESVEDAQGLAQALGITLHSIPIDAGMQAFDAMLQPVFEGLPPDTTEENIQARLRGNLLMAYSNKHGFMVLTTGNKSEMSVGYATLYGDMCGGYSVLKDVYKTDVFALAQARNAAAQARGLPCPIPPRMITKPPSAELRPNQRDEDSLPPYALLDAILRGLIEERLGLAELVARGHDAATVERVMGMLYRAEYKRRQSPPGVKITGMSFGRDRRYPITNHWQQMQEDAPKKRRVADGQPAESETHNDCSE
jgi:NAD+ synthase